MSGCPSENTVVALVNGVLDPVRASRVYAHVDSCAACCALLADLGGMPLAADTHAGLTVSRGTTPAGPSTEGHAWRALANLAGTRMGRYELKSVLGAGSMGVVYEAHDPQLKRTVAVKVLCARQRGGATERLLALRLLREARSMARLRHPHVVAVYDVGAVGQQVFVAMEFVRGGTLSTWCGEKRRSWRDILSVYMAAGQGLAAAHDAGLVHRDFKPDNVLVGVGGEVRVTDFGLARSTAKERKELHAAESDSTENGLRLTHPGMLVGTPAYMSPEQMRGEPATARSDLFSYCAALYEALHGIRPFEGRTLDALRFNVTSGRIRNDRPGSRPPGKVRRVLTRGLRARPDERHASMHDLLAELGRASRPERWLTAVVAGLAIAVFGITLGGVHAARSTRLRDVESAVSPAPHVIFASQNSSAEAAAPALTGAVSTNRIETYFGSRPEPSQALTLREELAAREPSKKAQARMTGPPPIAPSVKRTLVAADAAAANLYDLPNERR